MVTPWNAQNKPPLNSNVIVNSAYNAKYVGVRFQVIGHRVKNVLLKRTNVPGKNLIVNPEFLLPAPNQDENPLHSTALVSNVVVETIPVYPVVHEGAVVRVAGPGWKQPAEKLYVVLADNTYKNNSVKITELGGTQNGSWWPKVPRGYITVVPLADILK